ncbi:hypothetical protein NEIG_02138 [Nematocida sp. ERTm5]|nr:hypothetical protein NEIG_02138 [Nematocida sp. ERTm5]
MELIISLSLVQFTFGKSGFNLAIAFSIPTSSFSSVVIPLGLESIISNDSSLVSKCSSSLFSSSAEIAGVEPEFWSVTAGLVVATTSSLLIGTDSLTGSITSNDSCLVSKWCFFSSSTEITDVELDF